MLDEMQAAEPEFLEHSEVSSEAEQPTQTDNLESAPESSAGTEETQEKVVFDAAQQKKVDQLMAERLLKEKKLKLELAEFRSAQEAQQATRQRPHVPELPDPYDVSDEEYRQRLANRDAALIAAASHDALQAQAQQQANMQAQQQAQELSQSFATTAKAVGIDESKLAQDAQAIQQYGGLHPTAGLEIVQEVMRDDKGPLITAYLAQNPLELMNIQNMPPMNAYAYIMGTVKEKAGALAPRVSGAPPPTKTINGAGVPHNDRGRFTQNATFE